jgi:hypothetical protein
MRRLRVDPSIEVVRLGGDIAFDDEQLRTWVRDAGGCVSSLFGAFPVETSVFVIPVRGADEVVFGRTLSLSGASCAILVGDELPAARLHADWVLVHELFHMGCPSFVGEGHWLEEGLATYYEPILRARAGWMTERDLWAHFADQMRRGVPKAGEPPSIEERDDIDSTYWGGALFALLADVVLREHGSSLDDTLRAVHARGGDATHTWKMADVFRVGDAQSKTRVLEDVYASFAVRGEAPELAGFFASLGVHVEAGGIRLDDAAPRASLRRAIATGHGP